MRPLHGYKLFFIGAGGIGMSALARYFRRQGADVAGYDRTPSELTNQLQSEGVHMQFSEDPRLIPEGFRDAPPDDVMVVRTPAVPAESPLLRWWEERGAHVLKRAEVLGLITRGNRTVAVAGTHGKTTVSTMIAHLLTAGGVKCNAFLGGIAANYGTNVLLNDDAEINVVEADEYDRSFLKLCPSESVITAMDADHLDIYGSPQAMFDAYTAFAIQCVGPLLVHARIAPHFADRPLVGTYSLEGTGDPRVEGLRVEGGHYHFDLVADGRRVEDLRLGMPGRHNVENALAASTVALRLGVPPEGLRAGLASFQGVARRFDTRVRGPRYVYIDDYAHHPAELEACIASVRELYPGRHITGIFQPHLFSRTRDLAEGFATSLARLDALLLMDIYPAREEPIVGITSGWLMDRVPLADKRLCARDEVLPALRERDIDVVLTLGAGDIDRLVPAITELIDHRQAA